jgi:hypothetical protein
MRALAGRVKRLELGTLGQCPVCNGKGRLVVSHEEDSVPEGCAGCGQRMHIIICYSDRPLPRQRKEPTE